MASQERFGYEWNRYAELLPGYEDQFRNWTTLTPEQVIGKDILDAGCGMGRNSYWPLRWGAKSVTAFDFDERSVARTKKTLSEFPQAQVLFKDFFTIDWKETFDLVLCIGVLHHLEDPRKALALLTQTLRPGGRLLVWVYSHEGNELKVPLINMLRIITSRLSPSFVHALAYIFSIPLYVMVRTFPINDPYYKQLATFKFWHVHSIVFDQLIPTIAHYWRKDEVRELTNDLPLREVEVLPPKNKMGWILSAKKL